MLFRSVKSLVKFPSSEGSVPVISFSFRFRYPSFVNAPICVGIPEETLLLFKLKITRSVMRPSSVGNTPVRSFPCNSRIPVCDDHGQQICKSQKVMKGQVRTNIKLYYTR